MIKIREEKIKDKITESTGLERGGGVRVGGGSQTKAQSNQEALLENESQTKTS